MKIVSHRGNINGPNKLLENSPNQIDVALSMNFYVEVDLRIKNNSFWLGHDKPEYLVDESWLLKRKDYLLVHCKDLDTLNYLSEKTSDLNWFYHTYEDVVLTSKGWPWCYPGVYLSNGITVIQDNSTSLLKKVKGVCTDYPILFKN